MSAEPIPPQKEFRVDRRSGRQAPVKEDRRRPENAPKNVVYVQPSWAAAPVRRRTLLARLADRIRESRTLAWLGLELRIVLLVAVIGGLAWVGLRSVYVTKSQSGQDLIPGLHAPNLFPFLR
ncbi:MAG: hypothetical protein MH204_01330 [Fimbriimonadaceae bacterium]|nr:hypothetical protein [Fimbriimonadaceae bacterium]